MVDLLSLFFLSVAKEKIERKTFSLKAETTYLIHEKKSVDLSHKR
ncbi:hypothetical protein RV00_GL002934 [Enterococcus devriesei]|uniref:Uncharacterized protein n=1 Tax=Enterococcus devriesei TaxID=319970 RepID=A0A1L8STD5_9ENTE|nr:hypothetical protein RV00_GL002934 [Enterococcus devriesei]